VNRVKRVVVPVAIIALISVGVLWLAQVKQVDLAEPDIDRSEAGGSPATSVTQAPQVSKVSKREALSAEFSIDLGDGDPIAVHLYQRQFEPTVQVVESLGGGGYEELERRAVNGDAEAALALHQALGVCESYGYQSESDFRHALATLESEFRLPFARIKGVVDIESDDETRDVDVQFYTDLITRATEECRYVPGDAVENRRKFLELAATNGSSSAMKDLAEITSDKAERLALYMSAWEAGDYNAALWVGDGYEKGLHGEPDPVTAFAYIVLGMEITRLTMTDRNGVVARHYERIADAYDMPGMALALSHEEYARAIEMAKELLASNKNCCFGLWRIESMAQ